MTDFNQDGDIEVRVKADTSEFERQMRRAGDLGQKFGRQMTRSFAQIAFEGKKISDVLKSLAIQLSKMVLKAAFKPLEQAIGSGFSQLFGSIAGSFGGGGAGGGRLVPFASGGVINSPIAFPLGRRSTGIAGESGPEAIVPLARGADGRLGVRSQGGAGTQIIFNVTATDAESFARSKSQISAMLYRAVSSGQRNL